MIFFFFFCFLFPYFSSSVRSSLFLLESVQPKVLIRVDRATELSLCGSQSAKNLSSGITRTFAAAASDWLILVPNSVAPSTRIETFGWTDYI